MKLTPQDYIATIADLKIKNRKLVADIKSLTNQLEKVEAELLTSRANNKRIREREKSLKAKTSNIIIVETIVIFSLLAYNILQLFK